MSTEPTIKQKAYFALAALQAYSEKTGSSIMDGTALIDLLADLRHWCDQTGENFAYASAQAFDHYITEVKEAQ